METSRQSSIQRAYYNHPWGRRLAKSPKYWSRRSDTSVAVALHVRRNILGDWDLNVSNVPRTQSGTSFANGLP